MHPNFHHQDWLPRIPGNTVARGLGNEGEQDRLGRVKQEETLPVPTHNVMGREKRITYPNLGVRDCSWRRWYLSQSGRTDRSLRVGKGPRPRDGTGARGCGICPCRLLSMAGAWGPRVEVVRGDAGVEATYLEGTGKP